MAVVDDDHYRVLADHANVHLWKQEESLDPATTAHDPPERLLGRFLASCDVKDRKQAVELKDKEALHCNEIIVTAYQVGGLRLVCRD